VLRVGAETRSPPASLPRPAWPAQGADVSLPEMLGAGANTLPPAFLFLDLGTLAFALAPRASTVIAYGLIGLAFIWELFGALLRCPPGCSPSHLPRRRPRTRRAVQGPCGRDHARASPPPFLAFPPDVRRVVYTTNTIEALHRQIRKTIKTRGHFPTEEAARKLIHLAITNAKKSWRQTYHWSSALLSFKIHFGDRLP
jgi:hypothetical protein